MGTFYRNLQTIIFHFFQLLTYYPLDFFLASTIVVQFPSISLSKISDQHRWQQKLQGHKTDQREKMWKNNPVKLSAGLEKKLWLARVQKISMCASSHWKFWKLWKFSKFSSHFMNLIENFYHFHNFQNFQWEEAHLVQSENGGERKNWRENRHFVVIEVLCQVQNCC